MRVVIGKANETLALRNSSTRIVDYFGGTGNFLAISPGETLVAAHELFAALRTPCITFVRSELEPLVSVAEKEVPPKAVSGFQVDFRRSTSG